MNCKQCGLNPKIKTECTACGLYTHCEVVPIDYLGEGDKIQTIVCKDCEQQYLKN